MVSITIIFQYDSRTSILPVSDKTVDLGVRRSASGFFHDHIAMVAQKGRQLWECVSDNFKAASQTSY